MVANLLFEEGPGNIFAEALCLSFMFFADLALSRASLATYSLSAAISPAGSGVSLALAEFTLLSRVLGRLTGSAMLQIQWTGGTLQF